MKEFKYFFGIVLPVLLMNNSFAQVPWVTNGNVIATTEYVGANPGSVIPLELKTIPALAINFTTNNIQRGTILPNGFWGISNGAFTPQSKLHLNGQAGGVFSQWANNATGNLTVNDGLRIGINGIGTVQFCQLENTTIQFFSNAGINHVLRMHVGFDGISVTSGKGKKGRR